MEAQVRRERMLTDEDIQVLAEMMQQHAPICSIGLTAEEAGMVKRGVKVFNKGANIVGTVILVSIATGMIALFTKGFWMSLLEGVKR